MKEELLYFIWQLQYFNKQTITTTQGQPLAILAQGIRNAYSGPDFENARLHLDGIEWFGSVEIHVNASDWNVHGHQHDEAYNRVVLHVVWHEDRVVYRQDGTAMPTLTLKNRVDASVLQNYRQLVFPHSEQRAIPCARFLRQVEELKKVSMLDKAAALRLERKSQEIRERLERNRGDWSVTAYQTLVKSFGLRVNTAPFEQLSQALPLSLVTKYASDFQSLVTLLLGQAGLINDEGWPDAWRDSYQFLCAKHQLSDNALSGSQWRFFRTRPANFPTVRIVQLAALLASHSGDLTSLFTCMPLEQHYTLFDRSNRQLPHGIPTIGRESIHTILINAIVPYQFAYGDFFQQQDWKDHALSLLQAIPAEKNQLVSKYLSYGYPLKSAFDTQAVLELHGSFCEKKRCLSCTIGGSIIKNDELFVTSTPH